MCIIKSNVSIVIGEERCKIFFCDPYVSSQKPNTENANKQLRKFFPKKKSINKYTLKDIKEINQLILNTPIKSLDGNTPKQAFIKVFFVIQKNCTINIKFKTYFCFNI